MEIKVVDNFLPVFELEALQQVIMHHNFPWYYTPTVAVKNIVKDQPWNWYQTHCFYTNNQPDGPHYPYVSSFFLPRFKDLKSLIRIKANFYPHTETLKEHLTHTDFDFKHTAAIFSLNTCDGFTRMEDGSIVRSVANRMVFFDGSTPHNSSTLTSDSARLNINFNYI